MTIATSLMKLFLLSLFLLSTNLLYAQYAESIRSGRPGQSIGAFTLGRNVFQHQGGYSFSTETENETGGLETQNFNHVFRLGILERLEFSGLVNHLHSSYELNKTSFVQSGINTLALGGRYALIENNGITPALAIQSRYILPIQTGDFNSKKGGLTSILASFNRLNDHLSLVTNWIWAYRNEKHNYNYTCSLNLSLNEKWGTFIEMFGSIDPLTTNFDTGLSYLLNNDVQFDGSFGLTGIDKNTEVFLDIGISWRLDWR